MSRLQRLDGKLVVVTGACRRIGTGIARYFVLERHQDGCERQRNPIIQLGLGNLPEAKSLQAHRSIGDNDFDASLFQRLFSFLIYVSVGDQILNHFHGTECGERGFTDFRRIRD